MIPKNSENGQKTKKRAIMENVSSSFPQSIDRFEREKAEKVEKIQGVPVIFGKSVSHFEGGKTEKAVKTPQERKKSNRKRVQRREKAQ